MSNGSITDHPAIHWFFLKWPKWVKIATTIAGLLGLLGTFMGFGGTIVNAIRSRDTKMQAEAIAKQLDKEHDKKVDDLLDEHTKDIKDTKAGVQEIQNHLSKQDVEILGTKGQLDRIETAIISGNTAAHILPPTATPR